MSGESQRRRAKQASTEKGNSPDSDFEDTATDDQIDPSKISLSKLRGTAKGRPTEQSPAPPIDAGADALSDASDLTSMLGGHHAMRHPVNVDNDEDVRIPVSNQKTIDSDIDPPTVISSGKAQIDEAMATLTTSDLGSALVGMHLQNYELVEFVGGGGMGAVFRANDLKLGRTVAIKVLARTGPNGELAKRFINEAKSAARLDHENIARVHSVDEFGGLSYIVFEFVEGVNLRQAVAASGTMTVEQTMRYTIQIAEALDHASKRDVIHRDIKPSNILITSNGRIKLVDMGLARVIKLESGDPDLTASGMTLGTFDYLSPEQAEDPRRADVRSDLYSLGCTMFFMLTGTPPFPDGNAVEKLLHHREKRRPDPRRMRDDVPSELSQIIRKLMAPHAAQRFQSPGELMARLTWSARKLGISLTYSPAVEQAIATHLRRRAWVRHTVPVAVPAALLAGAFFAAEWFGAGEGDNARVLSPQYASSIDQVDVASDANQNDTTGNALDHNNANDQSSDQNSNSTNTNDSTIDSDGNGPADTQSGNAGGQNSSDETDTNRDADASVVDVGSDDQSGDVESGTNQGIPSGDPENDLDAANAAVLYLIVGTPLEEMTEEVQHVGSLAEAIEAAPNYPNLVSIQLRFNGERSLEAFDFQDGELTIEAADGYRPAIRMNQESNLDDNAMVVSKGLSLQWEGIDFVWTVANGITINDRSMFRIEQNEDYVGAEQGLSFRDCTFTCRFVEEMETVVQPNLAVVQVESPSTTQFLHDGARVLAEPPAIHLTNCSIRGPVNLISTPRATPYLMVWNQGLFISDKRLVECNGSDVVSIGFRSRLMMRNVTVAAQRGLARVTVSDEAPEYLPMWITATQCIFETAESQPLFEHVGVVADDLAKVLILDGENNYFPDRSPIWILRTELDPAPAMIIEFEDAVQDDQWFLDELYERGSQLKWAKPVTDRPTDVAKSTIEDYRLRAEPTNPAFLQQAGFDPLQIRPFPPEPVQPNPTGDLDSEAPDTDASPSGNTSNEPMDPSGGR